MAQSNREQMLRVITEQERASAIDDISEEMKWSEGHIIAKEAKKTIWLDFLKGQHLKMLFVIW